MAWMGRFCALLLLLVVAGGSGWRAAAQDAPAAKPEEEIDWAKRDARARKYAQRFFADLRDAGSVDGLFETHFVPETTSQARAGWMASGGAPPSNGCRIAPEVASVVTDSMLRRKLVADLDADYLEALYLFAARPWHKEMVASDFDLHDAFAQKLTRAEESMDFFRFAPATQHCAVEQLQTPGQLEQAIDETQRAAELLRAALPKDLWRNPEFRKQWKAAEGDRREEIQHHALDGALYFRVPLNALVRVWVKELEGRMRISEMRVSEPEEFVRRKPTSSMERAAAVADRFIARLHQELDLTKPMEELMVRNYLSRMRARRELPFFVGYTMNEKFRTDMSDEELREAAIASGNFLYLLMLHATQVMRPGASDKEMEDAFLELQPEILDAGRKNGTVSFLFTEDRKAEEGIPDVTSRDELEKFLKDLDEMNSLMRRELPETAFTSPGFLFVTTKFRREQPDETRNKDLGPEFPGPVQVFEVHREFFDFEIIEEDGELRIWSVDLH